MFQARCQKVLWHRADCCLNTQMQAGVAATGKGFRDSMEWSWVPQFPRCAGDWPPF